MIPPREGLMPIQALEMLQLPVTNVANEWKLLDCNSSWKEQCELLTAPQGTNGWVSCESPLSPFLKTCKISSGCWGFPKTPHPEHFTIDTAPPQKYTCQVEFQYAPIISIMLRFTKQCCFYTRFYTTSMPCSSAWIIQLAGLWRDSYEALRKEPLFECLLWKGREWETLIQMWEGFPFSYHHLRTHWERIVNE